MNAPLRFLFAAALSVGGLALAPAAHAQRTDSTSTVKPQLNTAPPGTAPRPATPAQPPQMQQVPVPAPAPVYEPLPAPQPSNDRPSGLDFPTGSRASEQPKPLRRMFIYSNFGLGYNSFDGVGQFNASISPALGFRLTERFAVGPGITYSYTNYSFSNFWRSQGFPGSISSSNVGVKGFAQFLILDELFVHAEYEVTRAEQPYLDQQGNVQRQKYTVNTPLAGLGYRQRFSDRAAADIALLYNFNDGLYNLYSNPVIRFSFLFDLK